MLLNNDNYNLGLLGSMLLNSAYGNNNVGDGILSALQFLNQQQQPEQYNPFPRMQEQIAQNNSEAIPMTIKKPSNAEFSIENLKLAAQQAWPNNPVMQQVAITQAIHESGLADGTPSGLAQKYNLFGIKERGNAGQTNMQTKEFVNGQAQKENANFGTNNSVNDSFMQHRNFLGYKRYKPVLAATTPQEAFQALQSAGYATDPKYSNSLNNIYSQYVMPLYQT